jgi:hypothetical protein
MNNSTNLAVLQELIDALDRRLPRVKHAGEAAIARDASALRAKALERIAELAGEPTVAPVTSARDFSTNA